MQAAMSTCKCRTSKPGLQRGDQSQAKVVTPVRERTGEGKGRKDYEKSGNGSARRI